MALKITDDCISCQPSACGDGLVWAGNEDCDDGNQDNSDDCLDNQNCSDDHVCQFNTCDDLDCGAAHKHCDVDDQIVTLAYPVGVHGIPKETAQAAETAQRLSTRLPRRQVANPGLTSAAAIRLSVSGAT